MVAQSSWASGLQVSRWAAELFYQNDKEIYFSRFMGEDKNSIIQKKHEVDKQPGKDITFGLRTNLSGSGITGDSTLEGNEEALNTYSLTATIDQLRNAVRDTGRMDNKKVLFDFRSEALDALKTWLAETIDADFFTVLAASPTTVVYGGDATSTSDIDSADKMEPALLTLAKAKAKQTTYKVRPIRLEGKEYYVCVMHIDQAFDLTRNTEWREAQREAGVRGLDNPIFNGMLGIWSGVVCHEHESVPTATNWGTGGNVKGATALFLGAQAGIYAIGGQPIWVEKTFDYGNSLGVAGGQIYEAKKAVFNSVDYGVIAIRTAATDTSAISNVAGV